MTDQPGFLEGHIIRTLKKTPRLGVEGFILDVGPNEFGVPASNQVMADETIVERRPFPLQPLAEPVLIYSRKIADAGDTAGALEYFRGNLAVTVRQELVRVDASGYQALDEDAFWPVIDELDGKLWSQKIDRAARLLSLHSEEFILQFAQRMAELTYQLDHPAISGARGAVIGGGRDRFEQVRANPGAVDPRWDTDSAPQVVHLASQALSIKRRSEVQIDTTWDVRAVGQNSANWADQNGSIDQSTPQEMDEKVKKRLAEHEARMAALPDSLREAIFAVLDRAESTLHYFAARYVLQSESEITERAMFFSVEQSAFSDAGRMAELVAQNDANSQGKVLLAPIDFFDTHLGWPMSFKIFEIKRRSSLTEEQYRAKYVDR